MPEHRLRGDRSARRPQEAPGIAGGAGRSDMPQTLEDAQAGRRSPPAPRGGRAVETGLVAAADRRPLAPDDQAVRVSHEAVYTWIYALPKGASSPARAGRALPPDRATRPAGPSRAADTAHIRSPAPGRTPGSGSTALTLRTGGRDGPGRLLAAPPGRPVTRPPTSRASDARTADRPTRRSSTAQVLGPAPRRPLLPRGRPPRHTRPFRHEPPCVPAQVDAAPHPSSETEPRKNP